jgi:hypothetical protein
MAASSKVSTKLAFYQVTGAPIDFDTDTLKCMVVEAGSGMPDTTNTGIRFVSDVVSGNAEVTGTGYARQTLSNVTVAYDSTNTRLVDFSFDTITFAQHAAGFSNGAYLIFFKDAGGADTANPVFCVCDPDTTLDVTGGDVEIDAPAGGLLQWST